MGLVGRIFVKAGIQAAIVALTVEFNKIRWIEQTVPFPLYIYRLFLPAMKKLDFLGINRGGWKSGSLKSGEIELVDTFLGYRDLVVLLGKNDPFVPNLSKRVSTKAEKENATN